MPSAFIYIYTFFFFFNQLTISKISFKKDWQHGGLPFFSYSFILSSLSSFMFKKLKILFINTFIHSWIHLFFYSFFYSFMSYPLMYSVNTHLLSAYCMLSIRWMNIFPTCSPAPCAYRSQVWATASVSQTLL